MTTASLTLRRPATRPGVLGLGISTLWLSIIVLLPLAAVVVRSTEGGFDTFWNAVSSRQAVSALRFTIDDLGGWKKVNKDLFDPRDGSIAKIEEQAGVTTGQ